MCNFHYQAKKTWLTPLHISVRRGLGSSVQFLLKNGADVNAVAEGDYKHIYISTVCEIHANVDSK
jgi:ankyrin repeat protein